MERKEYMADTNTKSAPAPMRGRPMGGPRGMGRGGEKAKDLVGTWKKLLGYCRKYAAVMVIALICAVAGTVLTLAGPDKLSDMTNAISEGMAPDTEKLEEIVGAVYANLSAGGADLTIDGTVISSADQQQLLTVLGGLDGEDTSAVFEALNELPDSVSGLIEPSIDMNKITEIGLLLVSFYDGERRLVRNGR